MSTILILIFLTIVILFLRAMMMTLGFYKEPVLAAFQQYGDEVGFSPLLESILFGFILMYLLFVLLVPSSFLIMFGLLMAVTFAGIYLNIKDNIMNYPQYFLQYPRWYREIVDHTTREERRKIAYMWLVLPLRTRLLYNTRQDAFRKWVELVVISVA